MRKNKIMALSLSCVMVSAMFCSCGSGNMSNSSYNDSPDGNYKYDYAPAEEYCDDVESDMEIMPEYQYSNEEYKNFEEQGFKNTETEPLSTFSADVDTASYSNVRRLIEDGMNVPEDAVRVEEFINYFDYDYSQPDDGQTFGEYVEISDCPWNNAHKLMMIGVQGKKIDENELPPSNIVFLIDSSGSMDSYDKLPLVQNAFSMLAEKLSENDRISIVTYAGSSRTVIAGENDKDKILEALYSITANGSTNGEGGINTAYELAEEYFIEGGNNRVILATDGDLNVGASSESELKKLIESKRDKGIYLSVLGFGTGNYKDDRLEAVADNGNGNYSYIDSVDEARRVLVEEMGGTLFTIAKDVKFQVEFNPSKIKSYRLVGYDNRIMNAEDFYDNTKDAGEVGSGHSVTALYEIELADTDGTYHGVELEFASEHTQPMNNSADNGREELFKFSTAYKDIDTGEDVYNSKLFGMEKYNSQPSDKINLASSAAEFAMLLKNSEYKGDSDYEDILARVNDLGYDDEKVSEFYALVKASSNLFR